MEVEIRKLILRFSRPGGTSRGILHTKNSWIIKATEKGATGIGEASLIDGLSPDDPASIHECLRRSLQGQVSDLSSFPAVSFALEMARHGIDSGHSFLWYDSAFSRGEFGIPINGLIWMGSRNFMLQQIRQKLAQGFRCIKIKIGAIDFEEELYLLKYIRKQFSAQEVELRVDANGAFKAEEAIEKLKRLNDHELHSIEQPIAAGQWEEMARLCEVSPLDIALDEELIGVSKPEDQRRLVETVRPAYLILKPSLLGGLQASSSWIKLAEEFETRWWVTSALESNIGLNAIAQWTANLGNSMPQGLGTGQLFENNIPSPLFIRDARLFYDPDKSWDLTSI